MRLTIFYDPHIITLPSDHLLQIHKVLAQIVDFAVVELDGVFDSLCNHYSPMLIPCAQGISVEFPPVGSSAGRGEAF